jgi:hypothetical protein
MYPQAKETFLFMYKGVIINDSQHFVEEFNRWTSEYNYNISEEKLHAFIKEAIDQILICNPRRNSRQYIIKVNKYNIAFPSVFREVFDSDKGCWVAKLNIRTTLAPHEMQTRPHSPIKGTPREFINVG